MASLGADGLPRRSSYGFNFTGDGKDRPGGGGGEDNSIERLGDVRVQVPFATGGAPGGRKFTHRFMSGNSHDSDGVVCFEGRTYSGWDGVDGKRDSDVVGKISAALFDTDEMTETLQVAADCMSDEVHDAMCALFKVGVSRYTDCMGSKPIGSLKKKCTNKGGFDSILYITVVDVKESCRGIGLALEIVRALVFEVHENRGCGCELVLLCPAADPHPGPAAWPYAFDSLAAYFGKMGFQRCGAANRRSGQSMYMFLETDGHDILRYRVPQELLHRPPTNVISEAGGSAASVKITPANATSGERVLSLSTSTQENKRKTTATAAAQGRNTSNEDEETTKRPCHSSKVQIKGEN